MRAQKIALLMGGTLSKTETNCFQHTCTVLSLAHLLRQRSPKCWLCGKSDHVAARLTVQQSKSLETLRNPGGTLVKPNQPKPPCSPCRTWWNSDNSGGTLVDLWWGKSPRTTPQLVELVELVELTSNVELWWNRAGTLQNPRGTYLTLFRTLAEPAGTLVGGTLVEPVEPSWNLTSNQPGPPCSPRRTWGGTLAETPKLSAVGEKQRPRRRDFKIFDSKKKSTGPGGI